jgi:MOSC domain-containing protein YiiM
MHPVVAAVSSAERHTMSKPVRASIRLIAGLGVEGDAHAGTTVKHRSRVARDPTQPNLRQVHLLHGELLDDLRAAGFDVAPGRIGENITTLGLDLLGLPTDTRLHIGDTAIVSLTGLRNPCRQLEGIQSGLMAAVIDRDAAGNLIRKAGVMGVVLMSGEIRPGDPIRIELPPELRKPLECV